MKLPGPDHPIAIAPYPGRVVVRFQGRVVADTADALALTEAAYPAVLYIPRSAARLAHFKPSAHRTHCPYKGDASHFDLEADGARAPNAVWSYEHPFPAMAAIENRLAFYPDTVEIETVELDPR